MIFEYLLPTVMAAVMTFITAGINQWKSMIFEYLFPTVMAAVMTRPLPGRPFQKFRVPQGVFRGPQGPHRVSGPGSKSFPIYHLDSMITISFDIIITESLRYLMLLMIVKWF